LEGTEVERDVGDGGKSWTEEDTTRLAGLLPGWGVDLLDVSSGGNHPKQKVDMFKSKDYQVKIAQRIRKEMKRQGKSLLIGAVGLITEAEQAKGIVEEAKAAVAMTQKPVNGDSDGDAMADVILVARQFMREPEWVLKVAWQLGVDVAWPNQFLRVRFPKL
jgi:2,4-dienoyl-CoA reductase-like NADH-dependent reductase (Old Yellow Enzyme family)